MMEKIDRMITTIDNPFNPFTEYDAWLDYDEKQGYFTNNYLARLVVAKLNPRSSEADADMAAIDAMDEMLEVQLFPYIEVYPPAEAEDPRSDL